MIKEYQKKHNNLILIESKVNEGACRSRDKGLEIAKGEYIFVIDSDDYVAIDALEIIYNKAKEVNADIAIGYMGYFYPGETRLRAMHYMGRNKTHIPTYPILDVTNSFINLFEISTNTQCCKMVRRSMILENDIKNDGYRISTDMVFSFRAMMAAERVVYIDDELYYYRQAREGSISLGRRKKKSVTVDIIRNLHMFLQTHHYSEEMELAFWRFAVHKCYQVMRETIEEYHAEVLADIHTLFNTEMKEFQWEPIRYFHVFS